MPSKICCICPIPLGGNSCDTTTGIAEVYYAPPCQINTIVYNAAPDDCCPEGEIASFALEVTSPTPLPEELLQPIKFVNQDDDTGALFTSNTASDAGNKQRNRTLALQVKANTAAEECAIDSMVSKEVAFVVKYKDGRWRLINRSGGMEVTAADKDSNTSYWSIVTSGRPNDRDLLIDPTWANENIVPISVDPTKGLVNA